MRIDIEWSVLEENDDGWQSSHCLYAYVAPDNEKILYIGKSWGLLFAKGGVDLENRDSEMILREKKG